MLPVLRIATLVLAGLSATVIVAFLVARPPLGAGTKVWLFLGIGLFPIGAAFTGNVAGFEASKERAFCASCHPMERFAHDAGDPTSTSLAAIHSRNKMTGSESCYVCHADYEMFGAITTKLNGMRHMYAYYTKPHVVPKLYKPYPNANCMMCHSTTLAQWNDEPEHQAVADDVRKGEVSCVGAGCHGPPHPPAPTKEAAR